MTHSQLANSIKFWILLGGLFEPTSCTSVASVEYKRAIYVSYYWDQTGIYGPFPHHLAVNGVGLLPSSLNSALKDLRINPRNDCPFISSTSRKERIKCRTVSSGSLQNTHSPASTISKKNAYLPPVSQTELRPYLQHDTLAVRHVCRNHCKL